MVRRQIVWKAKIFKNINEIAKIDFIEVNLRYGTPPGRMVEWVKNLGLDPPGFESRGRQYQRKNR